MFYLIDFFTKILGMTYIFCMSEIKHKKKQDIHKKSKNQIKNLNDGQIQNNESVMLDKENFQKKLVEKFIETSANATKSLIENDEANMTRKISTNPQNSNESSDEIIDNYNINWLDICCFKQMQDENIENSQNLKNNIQTKELKHIRKRKNIVLIDSGIGGLFILKECIKLIPNYNFIYIADTVNMPYGNKSKRKLIKIADDLIAELNAEYNPDIFVLACNTLTVNTIQFLRKKYNKDFVGIEPALKQARIFGGDTIIFATRSTLKFYGKLNRKCTGELKQEYKEKNLRFFNNDKVFKVYMPDLPMKIEQNYNNFKSLTPALLNKFDRTNYKNVGNLVLGCTHFIAIKKELQQIFGENVQIFDGAIPVAKRVLSLIQSKNLKFKAKNEVEVEKNIKTKNEIIKSENQKINKVENEQNNKTADKNDEMPTALNLSRIRFLVTDGNPSKKALLKQYFFKML